MRLYLIRHGRPTGVWGGGDDDPGLDDLGRDQAAQAARALIALPAEHRPSIVVSSPLRRCRETAQPLADALGVPIEIDPRVGEIPTPAGLSAAERPAWLRGALAGAWGEIQGDIDYEAWRQGVAGALATRAGAAVFSHFVAINAAVSVITGDGQVIGFRPDHASITTLALEGERLRLIARGDEARTGIL